MLRRASPARCGASQLDTANLQEPSEALAAKTYFGNCPSLSSYGVDHDTANDSVGAAAMPLWSGAAFAQDKPAFVFTAIPDQDETRLVERFTRVADYLQGKLGVPVKYLPVKSYPAAVTAFTNGQVQLAWFGGFTGVQARRQVPARKRSRKAPRTSRSSRSSSPTPRPGSSPPRNSRKRSRASPSPSARAPRPPAA